MEFSLWSLQVKVLQLENQLEQERVRLGELRKRHYELGSTSNDNSEGDADNFPPPPPPTLLDSTPGPQSFSQTQPYLNTQSLPPVHPFTPAHTQPYSVPQSYTPTHTYSQTQTYIPPPQIYTPTQPYTPPQTYTPSRPYIPSQPCVPNLTQNYFNSQTSSLSQLSSQTSSRPQSPSLSKKTPQNNTDTIKPASKKPNIFTKSGNLLKHAVSTEAS